MGVQVDKTRSDQEPIRINLSMRCATHTPHLDDLPARHRYVSAKGFAILSIDNCPTTNNDIEHRHLLLNCEHYSHFRRCDAIKKRT